MQATTHTPDSHIAASDSIGAAHTVGGEVRNPRGIRMRGIYRRRPIESRRDVDKRMTHREDRLRAKHIGLNQAPQLMERGEPPSSAIAGREGRAQTPRRTPRSGLSWRTLPHQAGL